MPIVEGLPSGGADDNEDEEKNTLTIRETKTDGLLWLPESSTPKWAN